LCCRQALVMMAVAWRSDAADVMTHICHAGAALRAGADGDAADLSTGRTPLHELAAAAAAAEVLGPDRGAAAGFILNMLLHAGVQVRIPP
jgi:hypothetical protein